MKNERGAELETKPRDPLIEMERRALKVQQELLDILEPLTDDQRFRVLAAVRALLEEAPDECLYQAALKRLEARAALETL